MSNLKIFTLAINSKKKPFYNREINFLFQYHQAPVKPYPSMPVKPFHLSNSSDAEKRRTEKN